MGTTASGFVYPDVGYTSGVRQAIEDLADSAEDVIREAGVPRFADAAARDAAITAPVLGMKAVLTSNETTYRYNGSAWKVWELAFTAYTPTLGSFASTGGTTTGYYSVAAGIANVFVNSVLGTSPTVGSITVSLPVACVTTGMILETTPLGIATFDDDNGGASGFFMGIVRLADANTVRPLRSSTANPGVAAVTSSTVPFTWAVSDAVSLTFSYPVA